MARAGLWAAALVAACPGAAHARPRGDDEIGAVGSAIYRHLDALPYLHRGVRTYQVSSADPTGRNDDGYTGRYSCLHRVPAGCLLASHRGPGELDSVWSPGPFFGDLSGDGRLRIELDGRAVVNAPMQSVVAGELGAPFSPPVVLTSKLSPGGYSVNLPMTFRRSMRVIVQHNPGYWHVVYKAFDSSRGVRTFRATDAGPAGVLRGAGRRDPKPRVATATTDRAFRAPIGRRVILARLRGSGIISEVRIRLRRFGSATQSAERAATDVFEHARLQIRFDGRLTVDAPLGEFFGSGLGPVHVRSLMFAMSADPHGWASGWWPMPYRRSAVLTLENRSTTPVGAGDLVVRAARSPRWRRALGPRGNAGYFHALGQRHHTQAGRYWTFLRTRGAGTFMGVTQTMEGRDPPYYLEGDEQAFVDGARRPQIQGTGTEDFYLGGWYWYNQTYSLPLVGSPASRTVDTGCGYASCRTAYRIMIADAVPFERSLLYRIEHGSDNTISAVYSSTAYWYQRPPG